MALDCFKDNPRHHVSSSLVLTSLFLGVGVGWLLAFYLVRSRSVYQSLSPVQLFAAPRIVAHQALLSMEFSRQEYQSGLPFPSPEDLPNPGIEAGSPALQTDSLLAEPPGKAHKHDSCFPGMPFSGVPWCWKVSVSYGKTRVNPGFKTDIHMDNTCPRLLGWTLLLALWDSSFTRLPCNEPLFRQTHLSQSNSLFYLGDCITQPLFFICFFSHNFKDLEGTFLQNPK